MPGATDRAIVDEQSRRLASEADALATRMLADRPFRKEVEKETVACSAGRTPPPPVLKLFKARLDAITADFGKAHRGTKVQWDETYKMKGKEWTLAVKARVTVKTRSMGGGSYVIAKGDTLWGIARATYGAGAYWPEIEKANRGLVGSGGKFILAGVRIALPKLEVPTPDAAPEVYSAPADRRASAPAACVAIPDATVSLGSSRVFRQLYSGPGCNMLVTFDMEGELSYSGCGEMPVGFNLSKYEAELKAKAATFATSITIKTARIDGIGLTSSLGDLGEIGMKWDKDGAISGSVKTRLPTRKAGGVTIEGSLTLTMTVKFLPTAKAQKIGGKVVAVAYDVAEAAIYVLAGIVVVVAAVAVVKLIVASGAVAAASLVLVSMARAAFPAAMVQLYGR
ncbi:MAG: LysM peptidoglycan-binding domain-containing protein [Gemmobacter sp.]